MAMIALQVVLQNLAPLVVEEAQLLGGIRKGVADLRDDLEMMTAFLEDAEARSETDQAVRIWVKQVKDVAFDTEDVLEEFVFRCPSPRGGGFLRRSFRFLQHLRTRHRLAIQITNIKEKVKLISERRLAFSLKAEEATSSNSTIKTWQHPGLASLFIDEADVVGIETPKSMLISRLVEGERSLTAISVVGMGGVGKTTLVKKVFDSPAVKNQFECHAWIPVSKSFTVVELLRALLKDFLERKKEPVPEGIDLMGELQLVSKLRDLLHQKRYVVFFDDIWSVDVWEAIKFALPDCCCGSRLLITTRIGDVAASIETTSYVYHLQPLPEEEAWRLFCMKAFRGGDKGVCPNELEEISKSILKKCGGLPLAIIAIGSLLSKKNRLVLEWKRVHDSLAVELKRNTTLQNLERLLLLSYKDLPYHLKCCFLYLSVFPEDYLIKRTKLIRLWVAEKLVEEKPSLTMEEVAEEYLNELVSRSMIQVVEIDYYKRIRFCRVHDVMREIIQLKSRDESFVSILDGRTMPIDKRTRCVSIHDSCDSLLQGSTLRSLLVFVSMESSISLDQTFFKSFRLLRVLELEHAPLRQFPPHLSKMILLRYLSLRRTLLKELPESIGHLRNLEILDLKYSLISSLPAGILKLENLVQLRGYKHRFEASPLFPSTYGMNIPSGIGRLRQLQKLSIVDVKGDSSIVREFGKLTQLRRLGILGLTKENGMDLCASLEKLKHLTALYMVSKQFVEPLPLDSLSSPPQYLQCLYLKSSVPSIPEWVLSLQYLFKLVLQYSDLDRDPLRTLQSLPNLILLELRQAFAGEELCCNAGGYPKLRKLVLKGLGRVKRISIEEGAMPGLRELDISSCRELETVPLGIEHLRNLQQLWILDLRWEFYQRIKQSGGEDFWRVQHVSIVKAFHWRYLSVPHS